MSEQNKSKLLIAVLLFLVFISLFSIRYINQRSEAVDTLGANKILLEFPNNVVIGSWVWKSPIEMSDQEIADIISYSKKEKINTLYIDCSDYLDIIEDGNPKDRQQKINNYEESLKKFLTVTKNNRISVHALTGNTTWANPSHSYLPPLFLKSILDFNDRNPDIKFDGVQFDIEYYNQPGYKASKKSFGVDYLKLVRELMNESHYLDQGSDSFQIGFAIPYWLDDENGNYILNSLLDILNTKKNTYIAIMSYRNYVQGAGGTMDLVRNELKYTSENASEVSVIIGQDTDTGETENSTFHLQSKEALKQAVIQIMNYSENYASFKGFAIHHFHSYRNLKDI